MIRSKPLFVIVILLTGLTCAFENDVEVARWQPRDFSFQSSASHENSFKVRKLDTLGFYGGAGVLNDDVHKQRNVGFKGHIAV
ncbi:MAG: hypothetical protein ACYTBJ_10395 [Planctomycetota bacterium]|jgi:hypothetical protein